MTGEAAALPTAATAAIADAARQLARLEVRIGQLWEASLTVGQGPLSARLSDASHALHRAGRTLDQEDRVG